VMVGMVLSLVEVVDGVVAVACQSSISAGEAGVSEVGLVVDNIDKLDAVDDVLEAGLLLFASAVASAEERVATFAYVVSLGLSSAHGLPP
jgi:hypothetical protein